MDLTNLTSPPAAGAENVYCPFYIRDGAAAIVCEGVTCGRDSVQRFKSASDKDSWIASVCASAACGRLCPQACVLNVLYDGDAPAPEKTLRVFEEAEKRRRNVNRTRRRRRAARRRSRRPDALKKDA